MHVSQVVVVVGFWKSFATEFADSHLGVLNLFEFGVVDALGVYFQGTFANKSFVAYFADELTGVRLLVAPQLTLRDLSQTEQLNNFS